MKYYYAKGHLEDTHGLDLASAEIDMEIGIRAPNRIKARMHAREAGLSLHSLRETSVDHYDQVFSDGDQLSHYVHVRAS